MPRDLIEFPEVPVVVDPVLDVLIAIRDFHSNPANWCNTGVFGEGGSTCIAAAMGRFADLPSMDEVSACLIAALPEEAGRNSGGIIRFNERMGTTHAELMAFYDRAISARKAQA